jgi:hypothetical protein
MNLALALIVSFAPAVVADDAVTPRLGKYTIKSKDASKNPPLLLGYFVLEKGGKYKILLPGGREVGEGTYEFDAAKKQIVWKTGTYKDDNWTGKFYVENDGKTHVVQVKGTTWAYNTPKDEDEKK